MGATAARQAREVIELHKRVTAIHLLILCQAADLRGADKLAPGTKRVYDAVREVSSYVEGDRELRDDIERVVELIDSNALVKTIEAS